VSSLTLPQLQHGVIFRANSCRGRYDVNACTNRRVSLWTYYNKFVSGRS